MEKVEPTPETQEEVSASSAELIAVEKATLCYWGRKALRYSATGFLGATLALGINNAKGVDTQIGPVNATAHMTFDTDSSVVAESLPLGVKFEDKTGMPGIGAGITINRTTNTEGDDLTNTGDILKNLGVLNDPKAVASKVVSDYERQALEWGTAGLLYGGIAGALLDYGGFGNVERQERRKAAAGLSILTLALSGYVGYQPTKHYAGNQWNQFDARIGKDAYLKFQYNGVLGNWAAQDYAKNEKTYNDIQNNTEAVLAPIAKDDELKHRGEKKINVFSDWHCNIGMARVIGTIDKTMGVNATINAGDDALGGTPQESICADILSYNLKDTAGNNYLGPGNHDFDFMIEEFKQNGIKVLDGTTATVGGVKVLGFADPTTSPAFVNVAHSRDNPNMTELQVNRLVDIFKNDTTAKTCKVNPGILIIHEPQQTTNAAMNCATLTINGHTHVVQYPQQISPEHTLINDGTIGGAASDVLQSVINTLGKEATSYIVYTDDGQPVGLRLITIKKNGTVEVSGYMPIPHPITDKQSTANDSIPLNRTLPGQTTYNLLKPVA